MSTKIYVGNALEVLPKLEANSVHCSVSSPPYMGLRRYEGAQQCEWPEIEYSPMSGLPPIRVDAMTCALGNEKTIESYISHLVAIYREVYRVLREDGVAWCVMGDSYSSQGGPKPAQTKWQVDGASNTQAEGKSRRTAKGLSQGNLMMVPHRLALALQADGWIVRNDVVWHKKSPMPESLAGWRWQKHRIKMAKDPHRTRDGMGPSPGGPISEANKARWQDCPGCPKCEENGGFILKRGSWRHTRAHEFVLMCTKKMGYFADQEKVREPNADPNRTSYQSGMRIHGTNLDRNDNDLGIRSKSFTASGRNPRSVLTPKPEPFPGKHFAVFPTSLITNLIKATCPDKCCPECGKGWAPTIKREGQTTTDKRKQKGYSLKRGQGGTLVKQNLDYAGTHGRNLPNINILGYHPTCECGYEESIPGTCLDLFAGSGTTGLVCERLGLNATLVEISREYAEMARDRIVGEAPLLNRVEIVEWEKSA